MPINIMSLFSNEYLFGLGAISGLLPDIAAICESIGIFYE
jgi:hypothetical protein